MPKTKHEVNHWYKFRTSCALNSELLKMGIKQSKVTDVYSILQMFVRHGDNSTQHQAQLLKDKLGKKYNIILNKLETANLITINKSYCTKDYDIRGIGKSYDYIPTSKLILMLKSEETEYLYKVSKDEIEVRAKSYEYKDKYRLQLQKVNNAVKWDHDKLIAVLHTLSESHQARVRGLLINITIGPKLTYSEANNRVYTCWAGLPECVRGICRINGLSRVGIIDIRSCWPSLWSSYIVSQIESPSADLFKEHNKYINMFLDPLLDPKDKLAKELNISRVLIKEVINSWINGKTYDKKLFKEFLTYNRYMKSNYPLLMKNWVNEDQTGNNICKLYEQKFFQNDTIYDYLFDHGMIAAGEYDGISVFAKDDSEILNLIKFLEVKSEEILGIKLIFKSK